MIQTPYILAEIPQDITGSAGQIFAADVHAITQSKKRKRSELAVAIDRQCVNVFDVQSSKLVTSYAVSPQTIFNCVPCSNRHRAQGSEPARRYTYCSVTSPKAQIICFSEAASGTFDLASTITTSSIKLDRIASPVSALDTFQVIHEDTYSGPGHKVLAIHKDGMVTCFSKDLAAEEWTTPILHSTESTSKVQVECAVVISVEKATQTFLKRREDLLATLASPGGEFVGSLLVAVTRSTKAAGADGSMALALQILKIEATSSVTQDITVGGPRKLKSLASILIPEPTQVQSKTSTITINAAGGTILQNAEGILAIYDLTGLVPCLAHELDLGKDGASSYLRLSADLIACSSTNGLSILALPYYSVQAESNRVHLSGSTRREDKAAKHSPLKLLSYFAPSDLVIAFDGRNLLAIQLSTKSLDDGGSKKRKRDGLLVNAIGRGFSVTTKRPSRHKATERKIKSLGSYLAPSPATDDWIKQTAELDQSASQGDIENFEREARSLLGIQMNELEAPMSKSLSHAHLDQRKVSHVLSKIFAVDDLQTKGPNEMIGTRKKLKMLFFPRKLCHWLIGSGYFTAAYIESSLKHSDVLSPSHKLETGAMIQAMAERDTSLDILSYVVASSVSSSTEELVHVLAVVMQDSQPTEHWTQQSNGSESGHDGEMKLLITDKEIVQDSPSPPPALARGEKRRHLLAMVMKKLYLIPSHLVYRALKSELSTPQLRILVDTLRMELAQGGWLSPYEDNLQTFDTKNHDDKQICYIAHLLNCTIDSIGAGGWLLGASSTDDLIDSSDTIAYMRAEVSAALEGIEEATYLKGVLEGILLCGKDTLHPRNNFSKPDETLAADVPTKPQTIALEEVSSLLPLGLKPTPNVSTTKVGAGGELIRRSARDIGRLKSKMVGKYSFERIVF